LPLAAVTTLGAATLEMLPDFAARCVWFERNRPEARVIMRDESGHRLLALADEHRLRRLLAAMLDPAEFLSPHGLRALSKRHESQPLELEIDGFTARLDYEPAESRTALFGGNSNWRGPLWFPLNYLLIDALRVYGSFLGDSVKVECPTGS